MWEDAFREEAEKRGLISKQQSLKSSNNSTRKNSRSNNGDKKVMSRIRDIERRFLQRNGWRARYYRRNGEWGWSNRTMNANGLHRSDAFNMQLANSDRSTRREMSRRLREITR